MTNKPQPKDFPPENPHDIEWYGYNQERYRAAIAAWEKDQVQIEIMGTLIIMRDPNIQFPCICVPGYFNHDYSFTHQWSKAFVADAKIRGLAEYYELKNISQQTENKPHE